MHDLRPDQIKKYEFLLPGEVYFNETPEYDVDVDGLLVRFTVLEDFNNGRKLFLPCMTIFTPTGNKQPGGMYLPMSKLKEYLIYSDKRYLLYTNEPIQKFFAKPDQWEAKWEHERTYHLDPHIFKTEWDYVKEREVRKPLQTPVYKHCVEVNDFTLAVEIAIEMESRYTRYYKLKWKEKKLKDIKKLQSNHRDIEKIALELKDTYDELHQVHGFV